jgi:hypothetical protein
MRLKKHARFAMALFVVTAFSVGAAVVIGSRPPAVNKPASTAWVEQTPAIEEAVKAPKKRTAKPVSSKTTTAKPAAAKTTAAKTTPVEVKSKTAAVSEPIAAKPMTTEASANHQSEVAIEAVTITGCLERDKDTFRLKDTDAPKGRNWKSGFLKKSSKVQVVDGSNRLKLGNHVGHRLAVTGLLRDRELEARSFKMVEPSC